MSVLGVENLTKKFGNEFVAVDNISFDLKHGEILSILGPNGAGKTTLISMIAGYLEPTSGNMYLYGEKLEGLNNSKKRFGVVFGGELGLYNNANVKDNLKFFSNLYKIKRSEISSEIDRVLRIVDLIDVKDKLVGELSRGMKQRVHIAKSLIGSPEIILLDEPTTGLDVEIAHDMRKIILELKNNGVSIILTTHIMSEIENLADRLIVIGAGKIHYEGTINNFMEYAMRVSNKKIVNLEEAYLEIAPILKRKSND